MHRYLVITGNLKSAFVTSINDTTIMSLEDFVREVRQIEDSEYIRLAIYYPTGINLIHRIRRKEEFFPLKE
jgi:hypothetical protein